MGGCPRKSRQAALMPRVKKRSASDLEKGQQKLVKRHARAAKAFKQLVSSRRDVKGSGAGVQVKAHKRRGKVVKGHTRRK
jgi:hypothetical protein